MAPSNLIQEFQQKVCPDLRIDSIEFTYKLIEAVSELKKDIPQEGRS